MIRVVHGLTALLWAGALVSAFALVGVVLLRLSRRTEVLPGRV